MTESAYEVVLSAKICYNLEYGIYNMLVQSEYSYIGFILPGITYIPILISLYDRRKRTA